MTKLDYGYNSPQFQENIFVISPSGVKDFGGASSQEVTLDDAAARPHLWFRQQFMKEDKFEGNTVSIRGTMIHWLAQQYISNGILQEDDYLEMNNYLLQEEHRLLELEDVEPIDRQRILDTYPDMWDSLVTWIDSYNPDRSEFYVTNQLSEHVAIKGQVDYTRIFQEWEQDDENQYLPAVGSTIVGDFKTISAKSMKKSADYAHILQTYVYAYCLQESGANVGGIEITYIKEQSGGEISEKTGKHLKLYPAETKSFVKQYTEETHQFVGSYLKMITETMEYFFKHPDTANILFKDQRLKEINFTKQVQKYKSKSLLD